MPHRLDLTHAWKAVEGCATHEEIGIRSSLEVSCDLLSLLGVRHTQPQPNRNRTTPFQWTSLRVNTRKVTSACMTGTVAVTR